MQRFVYCTVCFDFVHYMWHINHINHTFRLLYKVSHFVKFLIFSFSSRAKITKNILDNFLTIVSTNMSSSNICDHGISYDNSENKFNFIWKHADPAESPWYLLGAFRWSFEEPYLLASLHVLYLVCNLSWGKNHPFVTPPPLVHFIMASVKV